MIYTGICKDRKESRMAYAIQTIVFSSEREMFEKIFNDDCTTVLLTDDFVRRELHWSSIETLIKEIKKIKRGLKFVLVGTEIEVDTDEAYVMNISWDNAATTVQAVESATIKPLEFKRFKRNNILEALRFNLKSPDFLIDCILQNPELILPELSRLIEIDSYQQGLATMLQSNLDTLILENMRLIAEKNEMERDLKKYQRYAKTVLDRHESLLAKINKQYGVPYDENNVDGFKLGVCRYDKVLYIKELTRVHFVDSLLYYIQCLLNTLNDMPTRYIVIEKEYSNISTRMYPYHIPHMDITYSELKSADICMVGYQKDILNSILQNPSGAKYLIILDRSGHDFLAVSGDRVRTLYTLSDLADNKYFRVPADVTISYNTSNFYIPLIEGFESMNEAERINAYSSMEITKALITAIEERE